MTFATYLWIALGGACGSVGRAWLALTVARMTGPQFPWGTILINIIGSFVIGFFGTLTTASTGRLEVPADVRAFVMIGICGGFTTFSSFSLQTLELARDGQWGQALGNIALSVALCLASVSAGLYSAVALNGAAASAKADQAERPATEFRALAVVDRAETADKVLAAAAGMLRPWDGGRVIAGGVIPREMARAFPAEDECGARDAAQDAAANAMLRVALDRRQEEDAPGIAAGWTAVEGRPAEIIAKLGRGADVVVMRRPDPTGDHLAWEMLGAALFGLGRPVLVVPPAAARAAPADRRRTVAVAWRDDRSVERAIRFAIPYLRLADRVLVLSGFEGTTPSAPPKMPRILADGGVTAELRLVIPEDQPMGAALMEAARQENAALLVMGASSRGEPGKRMLGSVTRYMLGKAVLPVLVQH